MKILGAHLVSVTRGTATLKDAVDSAFEEYLKDPKNFIYAIGSVVGPHPFPKWSEIFNRLLVMKLKSRRNNDLEKSGLCCGMCGWRFKCNRCLYSIFK